jgi:hypothetical protein
MIIQTVPAVRGDTRGKAGRRKQRKIAANGRPAFSAARTSAISYHYFDPAPTERLCQPFPATAGRGSEALSGICRRKFCDADPATLLLLRCMSLFLALLRHADCIEQCPLSGITRKTFAQAEFFSV